VLHIAPTPFFSDRGCHIRIEGIVRALAKNGYDSTVATYHHGRDVEHVNALRIKAIPAYTKTEAGASKHKLLADWRLLWLVVSLVRKQKPDVLHAHLHEGLLIGLIVKCLFFWRRIPLVGDMQGSLYGELQAHGSFENKGWLKMPVKWTESLLMRLARTIVCSSEHSLQILRQEFGMGPAKAFLVQDGADAHERISAARIQEIKRAYGVENQSDIVVYTGALLAGKGLMELQQLIKLACAKSMKPHFLIVGYPVEAMQSFVAENDLASRVTLTGQVEFQKLPELLAIADIAVDPKNSDSGEGSGKLLNYLASGLPVLAFDTTNNRDFLPADSTLAVDTSDMVSLLLQWLDDDALVATIGDENLRFFKTHYSWSVTASQLANVYQRFSSL
jgi:glycosyltransferase involved in cell wall biosynthesis